MPPRPPAAGTPEGMNAAGACQARLLTGPATPHTPIAIPGLTSVSREEDQPQGRSSAGRSTLTPALLPAGPTAPETQRTGHINRLTPSRFFRDVKPSAKPTQVRTLDLP